MYDTKTLFTVFTVKVKSCNSKKERLFGAKLFLVEASAVMGLALSILWPLSPPVKIEIEE